MGEICMANNGMNARAFERFTVSINKIICAISLRLQRGHTFEKIHYIDQTRRHPGILDGVFDVGILDKSSSIHGQRFEAGDFDEFRTEGLVKHWRVHLGHLNKDVDAMSDDHTC